VPECKIRYYPNSAEALYRPVNAEAQIAERQLLPQGFRVMFAGNIGAAQDFGTIIGAAEKLRDTGDIHWIIIGDGRAREWVEHEIGRRNLLATVHLLGRHPLESMPRFFALANAMLVTLKNESIFSLTIPAKLQSYLACGRPIVAALDGEGARVIAESGAGIAVNAGDADGLARAVLSLYRMPDVERQTMGGRGHRYFEEHFNRDVLLARLEDWIADLGKPQ
jgi:glycosyltransferase involved in cell wall biosynthesis